jgi:uncharacterized protein
MKDNIVRYCQQIEKEYNVKILFAIESGSRLWRMASADSDYDVRFVFVQPINNYLSLNSNARELVINKNYEGKLIDMSGFDIFKFCKLLARSNPSIIEWLQSDILYYGTKPARLKKIALTNFNPRALYYHYKSMCRKNYEKYLTSNKQVSYKKYLYSMRGLVNAKYVAKTGKLPKIRFPEMLTKELLSQKVLTELQDTIEKKKIGNEKEIIKNNRTYDDYIENFLKKDLAVEERKIDTATINRELQRIVMK